MHGTGKKAGCSWRASCPRTNYAGLAAGHSSMLNASASVQPVGYDAIFPSQLCEGRWQESGRRGTTSSAAFNNAPFQQRHQRMANPS